MTDDCRESETAQRYVAGNLPEADVEQFELHLLKCERCRSEVRLGTTIASSLRAEQTSSATARLATAEGSVQRGGARDAVGVRRWSIGRPRTRRFSFIALPAIAAAAAVVMLVAQSRSGLDELEGIIPPAFSGAPSRSTADGSSPVDVAMEAYASGDYRRAAELLGGATAFDSSASVAFYLGVARLVTGDTEGALHALALPRSADGSSYQFDASLLAAKAHLRLRNPDSAVFILRAIPYGASAATHAKALADSILARLR